MDNEFEPHDEREISDNLDQKDFEPYDPDNKQDQGEKQQIENDKPNTQANEKSNVTIKPPDNGPPINIPRGKGDTIINIPQQSGKKDPPKSQPKSAKSSGKFWENLERGIAEFLKGFKEFFVKSEEEINRELTKRQYKNNKFEK